MKNIALTCQYCGATFKASRQDAKYCSNSCRTLAHKQKNGWVPTGKTSIHLEYSSKEIKKLKREAKKVRFSTEDLIKSKSLLSILDINKAVQKIESLKQEIKNLKIRLSFYNGEPAREFFIHTGYNQREQLMKEAKIAFPDLEFNDAIIHIILNYRSDITKARIAERNEAIKLIETKKKENFFLGAEYGMKKALEMME